LQGTALGRQTAAASLGQAIGSAAAGLLFGATFLPNAVFTLTAIAVLASLGASVGVPRLLANSDRSSPAMIGPPDRLSGIRGGGKR
jgi:hypothetical protein